MINYFFFLNKIYVSFRCIYYCFYVLQESEILRQLITKDELEPLADKCTKVYVWHTRTEKPKMNEENKLRAKSSKGSNDGIEV